MAAPGGSSGATGLAVSRRVLDAEMLLIKRIAAETAALVATVSMPALACVSSAAVGSPAPAVDAFLAWGYALRFIKYTSVT